MECTAIRDEMMEVLYGEAPPATLRVVEDHTATCRECREELDAFRRLRRDLGAWKLPTGWAARERSFAPPAWLWAAAAVLFLAVGAAAGFALAENRLERRLEAREARQLQEIVALRAEVRSVPSRPDAAILEMVDARVRQSEARQAVFLRDSLADIADRTEAQRRYDLARVSAGLSYLDGKTGQTVARTTELMGYVLQASQK